jgi:hypothetical protein
MGSPGYSGWPSAPKVTLALGLSVRSHTRSVPLVFPAVLVVGAAGFRRRAVRRRAVRRRAVQAPGVVDCASAWPSCTMVATGTPTGRGLPCWAVSLGRRSLARPRKPEDLLHGGGKPTAGASFLEIPPSLVGWHVYEDNTRLVVNSVSLAHLAQSRPGRKSSMDQG